MKILVTGSKGYIGTAVCNYLHNKNDITYHTRDMFDLTNSDKVYKHLSTNNYDVVIHTAVMGGSRLKPDDPTVLSENLTAFYNLYDCKNFYNRFITFGSGAEYSTTHTYYGLSKRCIYDIIKNDDKFINLRIYAVFDENEWSTRFIKSAVTNYINKKDIVIHQDKYMDFFAMHDLLNLVDHFCNTSVITNRVVDCCYSQKNTLNDIANYINTLADNKSKIIIEQPGLGESYIGFYNTMPCIDQIGLHQGIKHVYTKLLKHV
jgi:nucleoside-diphosphate-sugar epimerase